MNGVTNEQIAGVFAAALTGNKVPSEHIKMCFWDWEIRPSHWDLKPAASTWDSMEHEPVNGDHLRDHVSWASMPTMSSTDGKVKLHQWAQHNSLKLAGQELLRYTTVIILIFSTQA